MARLKRASQILNWDVLDEFYGYELKGINLKPNNFERGFCRCGETTTSYADKCSCGNFSFRKITNEQENCYGNKVEAFYDGEVFDTRYSYKTDTDSDGEYFEIVKRDISFKEQPTGGLQLNVEDTNIIKLYENKLIIETSTYSETEVDYDEINRRPLNYLIRALRSEQGEDILEYFTNNCEFLVEAYSDFIKYIPEEGDSEDARYYWEEIVQNYTILHRTIVAALFKFTFAELLSDPLLYRYPYILKSFAKDFATEQINYLDDNYFYRSNYQEWTSLENFLKDARGHYEIVEFVAKEEGTLSTVKYEKWGKHLDIYSRDDCKIDLFLDRLEDDEMGLSDMVFHYVQNGMIPYYEGNRILSQSKRFDDDEVKFFKIYLKENISNVKMNLVANFRIQLEIMDKYHIEKTEENFKLKTYNFLVNQACLAETYRLPQDKVDMFLDMFEVNPLEAMTLISNRRKMTKKELDAFLEVMFKN